MTDQKSRIRMGKMRMMMTGIDSAMRSQRHKLIAAEPGQPLIDRALRTLVKAGRFSRPAMVSLHGGTHDVKQQDF
jgi:hypothetical protein